MSRVQFLLTHGWGRAYGVLFGLSVFGFPVVSAIPVLLGIESRGISTIYRALVVALSIYVLLYGAVRGYGRISGLAFGALTALVLIILMRMLWDSVFARLPLDLRWQDMWLFAVGITLLPAAVFLFLPSKAMLDMCYRSALTAGTAAAVAIALAIIVTVQDLSKLNRLATEVLNPISVGHVGTSLVIVCLARVAAGTSGVSWGAGPITRAVMSVAGLAMTLASASKGPILALAVTTVLAIVLRGEWESVRTRLVPRVLWAALVPACAVAIVFALNELTPLLVLERFSDLTTDTSTMTRARMMSDALSEFNESPLLGSATVEYHQRFYPHNIAVEALMVGGVACFSALLVLVSCALRAAARVYGQMPERRWLVLLFVQYLIDSMLSGSLYESPTFWVTTLIVLATAQRLAQPRAALGHIWTRTGEGA